MGSTIFVAIIALCAIAEVAGAAKGHGSIRSKTSNSSSNGRRPRNSISEPVDEDARRKNTGQRLKRRTEGARFNDEDAGDGSVSSWMESDAVWDEIADDEHGDNQVITVVPCGAFLVRKHTAGAATYKYS